MLRRQFRIRFTNQLDERLCRILANQVAGAQGVSSRLVAVALLRGIGSAHEQADSDLGVRIGFEALLFEGAGRLFLARICLLRSFGHEALHEGERLPLTGSIRRRAAREPRSEHPLILIEEEQSQARARAPEELGICRTREHGVVERRPLARIAEHAVQLGKVEPVGAVHRIPAHRLLEGIAGERVLLLLDIDEGEVRVHPVERNRRLLDGARVFLNPAICQKLE